MKLILKLVLALGALVVLLLVCAVIFGGMLIDSGAKTLVEKGGTYALGTKTTLQSADVGLFKGTFAMKGLNVANPPGFSSPTFFALGAGAVAIDPKTIQSDVIEVPTLSLDGVTANLEKANDKTNYKVILDNLAKVTGSGSGEKKPQPSGGKDKRFIIKDLSIKNVTVKVDVLGGDSGPGAVLKKLTAVTIPIDEIKLKNVGQTGTGVGGTGVTSGELMGIIVRAVLGAGASNGGGLIPGDMLGDLQGSLASLGNLQEFDMQTLGNAKGTVENFAKDAEKALGDVKKTAEDATKKLEKAGEGLKNLIPKKP